MTRNLPEPRPDLHAEVSGKQKVHAAVDATLEPLICRRFVGKVKFEVDMTESGIRFIKVGTEEVFKST